jgi:hypothetical protein
MFHDSKYTKWYFSIISSRKNTATLKANKLAKKLATGV